MIVCKFGCTKDIESRMKDHQSTYGKLNNVELNLLMFAYIDPQFIFEAETNIKDYLNQYDMIRNKYSGHIKELYYK